MKGKPFYHRMGFAWQGIKSAFMKEASFRVEILAALAVIFVTVWLHPAILWQALVVVMISLVLAAELFNTALEQALDGLHAEQAEFVRIAKDCAAGAVLVFSIASVIVFVLMVLDLKG